MWKTNPNPVMTHHIRDGSRKPSTPHPRDGAQTQTSPPLMLKHKTVIYPPLPRKWSVIVLSERFSVKILSCRNQFIDLLHKSIYWFLHNIIPTVTHLWTYFSMEIINKSQRQPNIRKHLYILIIHKVKLKLALKVIKAILSSVKNRIMYKPTHHPLKQVNDYLFPIYLLYVL